MTLVLVGLGAAKAVRGACRLVHIRNRTPLGPYGRTMPGALVLGEGRFLMSEVPLCMVVILVRRLPAGPS